MEHGSNMGTHQVPLLTLLELGRLARQAQTAAELQHILVNQTYKLMAYELAVLWVEGEGVISQSGVSSIDRHAPYVTWLSQMASTLSSQLQPVRIEPAMLHQSDVEAWSQNLPQHALWIPLQGNARKSGLLIARENRWEDNDIAMLFEWSEVWSHCWKQLDSQSAYSEISAAVLGILKKIPSIDDLVNFVESFKRGLLWVVFEFLLKPLSWRTGLINTARVMFQAIHVGFFWLFRTNMRQKLDLIQSTRKKIWDHKKRRWTALILMTVFFPVRLTVFAPATLVPINHANIRVPLDGIVDKFFVEPNQKVIVGQSLFQLDLTSVQARLNVAKQEVAVASSQYRQSALQSLLDAKSKSDLTPQNEKLAEKQVEAKYLAELLEKSQIKSPHDGIALFDDPSDWIGRPVSSGEKVMEIAIEGQSEVEAWISVADAIQFPDNAAVTLFLNADPLHPLNAHLRYLGHEAVQRPDGGYAYRARARLESDQIMGRIGLKGTAKISGQWVPLSYWVMRRPLAFLRQLTGF